MEYVVLLYSGLKVIFLVGNNLCNITVTTLLYCKLPAESLKLRIDFRSPVILSVYK